MMDDMFELMKGASDKETLEWLSADPKRMLYAELFIAELQARKGGKRRTCDTHRFEVNLYENLSRLTDAIWNYQYKPSRGMAHIIFDPVQREIFAAPYVDRVVHHFVVNSIIEWWERRFHSGSCSCRVGKGTAYGIKMLDHHIRSASENYKKEVLVVKMDIKGYFMHINRKILWKKVSEGLDKQFAGNYNKRYFMLKHVCKEIIFDDPVDGVKLQGSIEDWRNLPHDKSLFCQLIGIGMVIGNLTSQFFSNIYLNNLDWFIARDLGYKRYGRYVDDFYIVVSKEELPQAMRDVEVIENKLNVLGMNLNRKKTRVIPSWQGVPFLGMVVKHGRIVPNKRIEKNFALSARETVAGIRGPESVQSYLGLLNNYNADGLVKKVFKEVSWDFFE